MNNVLIAGGSGLIGSNLIKKLKQKNISVTLLSRSENHNPLINSVYWNPMEKIFPNLDLKSYNVCINFCGEDIFGTKITPDRERKLLESRTTPIDFLLENFKLQNVKIKHFVSASAIGIYPNNCLNEINENSTHGNDSISKLVEDWELYANQFIHQSECVTNIRIGIVLSNKGGFLKKIILPTQMYMGAIPGKGTQMVSWIHIDDLSQLIIHCIENQLNGPYNACAPTPVSLSILCKTLASSMNRFIFLPNIPEFILNIVFGKKRAELILSNQNVSSKKIQDTQFKFQFPDIQSAINNLMSK
jgi:uncharacterized protein